MANDKKPVKPVVTSAEKKYREQLFPDIKEVKNKNFLCTSCGRSVKDLILKGRPISHPFFATLLCEKCSKFYGDGDFSEDEDGCDKYCRWCGQGGTLFLCSSCTSGLCKRCVKRNLPRSALQDLEKDDWECYCCVTKPLFELRAQCWAAQQYAALLKDKKSSREAKKQKAESDSDEERTSRPRDKKSITEAKKRKAESSSDEERSSKPKDKRSMREAKKRKEESDSEEERSSRSKDKKSSREAKKLKEDSDSEEERSNWHKDKKSSREAKKQKAESDSDEERSSRPRDKKSSKEAKKLKEDSDSEEERSNRHKDKKSRRRSVKGENSSDEEERSVGKRSGRLSKTERDSSASSSEPKEKKQRHTKETKEKKEKIPSPAPKEEEVNKKRNESSKNISSSTSSKDKKQTAKIDPVEEDVLNGVKKTQWMNIIKVTDDCACDIAKLSKVLHKKIVEFKVKKINFKNINSFESLSETRQRMNEIVSVLSSTMTQVLETYENVCEKWTSVTKSGSETPADTSQLNDVVAACMEKLQDLGSSPQIKVVSDEKTDDESNVQIIDSTNGGKSTPTPKGDEEKVTKSKKSESGKTTPAPEDDKEGKTKSGADEESNGMEVVSDEKTDAENNLQLTDSTNGGKSTPTPKDDEEKVTKSKKSESGKTTPAPEDDKGGKTKTGADEESNGMEVDDPTTTDKDLVLELNESDDANESSCKRETKKDVKGAESPASGSPVKDS